MTSNSENQSLNSKVLATINLEGDMISIHYSENNKVKIGSSACVDLFNSLVSNFSDKNMLIGILSDTKGMLFISESKVFSNMSAVSRSKMLKFLSEKLDETSSTVTLTGSKLDTIH